MKAWNLDFLMVMFLAVFFSLFQASRLKERFFHNWEIRPIFPHKKKSSSFWVATSSLGGMYGVFFGMIQQRLDQCIQVKDWIGPAY